MSQSVFLQIAFLSAFVTGLTACSSLDPFVDARREAGQIASVGSSTNDYPVICYGVDMPEKIEWLAQNECAKTNRRAVFVAKESFSCSLLKPRKAIYRCEKNNQPVPAYQSVCDLKNQ